MPRQTNQQLQQRIAELEAENDALRSLAADASRAPDRPEGAIRRAGRRRSWGWTLLATALIVIGAVLAPVAVIANWTKAELSDTDTFVATFAPLAKKPAVQAFVSDEVVTVIDDQVDIKGMTSDVFDGIASLGLDSRARTALKALEGPAADGIKGLMHSVVSDFVTSKAFAAIWEQTLRTTHEQLIATMQNDKNAAVEIGRNGEIGIQLGPIINEVKRILVDQGVTFAKSIPAIDKTIVVAHSDAVGPIQSLYGLAIGLGAWLQWVALAFLVAGVLVALRRSLALIWAAIALGLSMVALAVALTVGRAVVVAMLSPSVMPADTAQVLYDDVVAFIQSTTVAVAVLALAVAVAAWLAGPYAIPRRLRRLFSSGADALRRVGDRYRLSTGAAGGWLYRQRVLVRVFIAAIGAAVVLFVRPLSSPLIIWTLVLCAVAVGALEILQRPDARAQQESGPPLA